MKYGIVILGLLAASCGDAMAERHELQSPLVVSDAQGPYLAFVHSEAGWQWTSRAIDGNRTVQKPLWGDISDDLGDVQGQSGALNFSASAAGGGAFTATVPGYGFGSGTAGNVDFSAQTPAAEGFDPSLGYGFAGQCDLSVLCDVAARACSYSQNCNVGDINECYSAVASSRIPAELGPYICLIADFLTCSLSQGERACLGVFADSDEDMNGVTGDTNNGF